VAELEAAIRHHDELYWERNAPEISDYEYDRLVRRLTDLQPDSPALQRIGAGRRPADEVLALGEAVVHRAPMLSLDKCYEPTELARWAAGFRGDVVASPKVDGVAASLRYDAEGRLERAATRGDGLQGEDFTANARLVPDIPERLAPPADAPLEGPVEIRGEVYMTLSTFARHAEEAANPRNLTAGTVKRKQASRQQLEDLSFFAYDLLGTALPTEHEKLRRVEALGFRTVEPRRVPKDALQGVYEDWLARRQHLDYELDGVVFKVNDVAEQKRLGSTAHHPRYAIAYKFQGDSGESTLERVEWSVARTGAITPVAIITPVKLSGAMVSRCSLHNLNILRQHALHLGDTVVAMRRGGVIPNIEKTLGGGSVPVEVPDRCPGCGGPARLQDDSLACRQPRDCRGVQLRALEHFVKALDIEGLGERVLEQLFELGLVRRASEFFELEETDLLRLELVGEVLAAKLVANIDGARTMPLDRFLRSLGVEALGQQTAKAVAERFPSLEAVLAADAEALAQVRGVGTTLAERIRDGLAALAPLIEDLRGVIRLGAAEPAGGAGPLSGSSVVFTGTLASMGRTQAQRRVREAGGESPPDVTRDLDFLVVGDKGSPLLGGGRKSSKQTKAEEYNRTGSTIRIIGEAEFFALLQDQPPSPDDDAGAPEPPQQGKLL
jgi:DNA ligase (NAD+)